MKGYIFLIKRKKTIKSRNNNINQCTTLWNYFADFYGANRNRKMSNLYNFIKRGLKLDIKWGYTLIERKLRIPQIQGVKGEAVVNYCKSLTTQKMGYHRLSRRGNKIEIK